MNLNEIKAGLAERVSVDEHCGNHPLTDGAGEPYPEGQNPVELLFHAAGEATGIVDVLLANPKIAEVIQRASENDDKELFIVPTPTPYIVNLAHWDTAEKKAAAKARLLQGCEALWKVLALLGVPVEEAHEHGYSLNISTREALMDRARSQGNRQARELLLQFD